MIASTPVKTSLFSIDISFLNELPLILQTGTLREACLLAKADGTFSTVITFEDGSSVTRSEGRTAINYAA